jgi:acyl-CoA dehydrogenase
VRLRRDEDVLVVAAAPPEQSGDSFYSPEREALRQVVADFTRTDITPHLDQWETAGEVPRSLHLAAAKLGLLGLGYPEAVGGVGGDLRDVVVMTEAMIGAGAFGGLIAALFTHGIAVPHVFDAAQRSPQPLIDEVIRPTLQGEAITALGVTEPDGGSDVAAIRTRAVALDAQGLPTQPQSAHMWRINGAKAYITSGARADFVVTAVRAFGEGAAGVGLCVIPTTTPGFDVVRRMAKMGWRCSDTAELSFVDVDVPAWAMLTPAAGDGFASLARHFAVERINLAVTAYATAQRCLDLTVAWVRERETFGRPLVTRQVVRHELVEMHRQIDVARTYTHAVVNELVAETLSDGELLLRAAMAKNTAVAACDNVTAQAVQLHGCYGFLEDSEGNGITATPKSSVSVVAALR